MKHFLEPFLRDKTIHEYVRTGCMLNKSVVQRLQPLVSTFPEGPDRMSSNELQHYTSRGLPIIICLAGLKHTYCWVDLWHMQAKSADMALQNTAICCAQGVRAIL